MSKIIIPTPLRKFTQNESTVITQGITVGESLSQLVEQYPDLQKHLHDDSGKLRTFIRVYVGEEDIKALQGEDTPIEEGTVISIIPAIAGGTGR